MTFEESMENIKNRLDALTMNLELLSHHTEENWKQIAAQGERSAVLDRQIAALKDLIQQDAENIRALARIAEAHDQRLSDGGL